MATRMFPTGQPRDVRQVRMREVDEWALIKAGAAKVGVGPSTYLREAALREARRELLAGGDR